jgi:hypothetical protein
MNRHRAGLGAALACGLWSVIGCVEIGPAELTRRGSTPTADGGGRGLEEPVIVDHESGEAPSTSPVQSGGPEAAGPPDCSALLVCDDFEQNTLGEAPTGWNVVVAPAGAGTIAVSADHAYSGTKSVRLVSTMPDAVTYVQIHKPLVLTVNTLFGRMNLWAASTPYDPRHWNLIEGWGYVPGSTARTVAEQRMYQYGGGGTGVFGDRALAAYYLSDSTDCVQSSTSTLPLAKWTCVEWEFDGTANAMRFWLDGELVEGLTVTQPACGGTWSAPAFERLDLGWYNAPAEAGRSMEMWIDDVAVDTQRVGCLAP